MTTWTDAHPLPWYALMWCYDIDWKINNLTETINTNVGDTLTISGIITGHQMSEAGFSAYSYGYDGMVTIYIDDVAIATTQSVGGIFSTQIIAAEGVCKVGIEEFCAPLYLEGSYTSGFEWCKSKMPDKHFGPCESVGDLTPCTVEGVTRTYLCDYGTNITTHTCIDGKWVYSGIECPPAPDFGPKPEPPTTPSGLEGFESTLPKPLTSSFISKTDKLNIYTSGTKQYDVFLYNQSYSVRASFMAKDYSKFLDLPLTGSDMGSSTPLCAIVGNYLYACFNMQNYMGGQTEIAVDKYLINLAIPASLTYISRQIMGTNNISQVEGFTALKSGGLFVSWHEMWDLYSTHRDRSMGFAYMSPTGVWTALPNLSQDVGSNVFAGNGCIAQHPVDDGIWVFTKRDSAQWISAFCFRESGGSIGLDITKWNYGNFLNEVDGELPILKAVPYGNKLYLIYQNDTWDAPIWPEKLLGHSNKGCYVSIDSVATDGSHIKDSILPEYSVFNGSFGFIPNANGYRLVYYPVSHWGHGDVYTRVWNGSTWSDPAYLGFCQHDGSTGHYCDGIVCGSNRFVVPLVDSYGSLIHLFEEPP